MKMKPRKKQLWESFSLNTLRRMASNALRYAQRQAASETKVNLDTGKSPDGSLVSSAPNSPRNPRSNRMIRFLAIAIASLTLLAPVSAQPPPVDKLQAQLNKLAGKQQPPAKQVKTPTKNPQHGFIVSSQELGPDPRFKRGRHHTQLAKVMEALRTGKLIMFQARNKAPASVAMVPKTLSMLGNDSRGDCVTAANIMKIEGTSVLYGLPQIVVSDQTALSWAESHGVADGADLLSVAQMMNTDGIQATDGKTYKEGTPATVNINDEATLQAAIATGPVDFGIDANALPSGAGNSSGWYVFGGSPGQFGNEDHDVTFMGFGPGQAMCAALDIQAPSGMPSTTLYLVYTWSTIGLVDYAWVMSTAGGDSYVGVPPVIGLNPTPPPQIVVGFSTATAAVVGVPYNFQPSATGGVAPYLWQWSYGDGASGSGTGPHTYTTAGTFTVTATVADTKGSVGTGTATLTVGTGPTPPPPTGATITLTEANGSTRTFIESTGRNTIIIINGQEYQPAPAKAQQLK